MELFEALISTHPERDVVLQLLADWPLGRHVLVVSLGLRLLHILLLPLVHSSLQTQASILELSTTRQVSPCCKTSCGQGWALVSFR